MGNSRFRLHVPIIVLACTATAFSSLAIAAEPERAAPANPSLVAPKLLSDPTVPYPDAARGDAVVRLRVTVDANGNVKSAEADEPNEPFSSAAEAAVQTWTFEPALRDGRAIVATIAVEITFREPQVEEAAPAPDLQSDNQSPASEAATAAPAIPKQPPAEVLVLGQRPEPSRSATLSRAEVRQIPGTFGDPFRAIEALPGVTPVVSGLPFFFVRGAPPGNVGYFLDGVQLPLLFHVGAGPSIVHPGLIERVDLFPGGYPARFGRFAGGIVSGETALPSSSVHGEYNVRLFDAGALLEAPFAEGRGSALVSGRYSYTALLLSLLSPDYTLSYWDYQARLGYDVGKRDRLTLFAFGSYDYLGQKANDTTLTLFGTEFHRVDVRHDHALARGGNLRNAFTLGIDRSETQEGRFVRSRSAATRTELDLPLSSTTRLRAGSNLSLAYYDIELGPADLSSTVNSIAALFPSRTDMALGVRADVVWQALPRLDVTPGVRIDLYGSEGTTAIGIDPRLSLRTELTKRIHLNAALGIAHQPPAFVVPLPGFQPGGLRGGLQRALQESFGVEAELGAGTTASATLFQNAFFQMSDPLGATEPRVAGCPPGAFPTQTLAGDRLIQATNPPPCRDRFDPGTLGPDNSGGGGQASTGGGNGARVLRAFEVRTMGQSYGLELYIKRALTSKLGGFLSYTLSRSTRSFENRRYVATFDRTHVFNAALAYDLGRGFRAGGRVMFYTGLPAVATPDNPDGGRLPAFFRLDLRLEKRWRLGENAWISAVAEWLNATLSKEALSTRCTLAGCEAMTIGPITIPSLGVEGGF
ncbi:MAG: TonB family protein [Myxococcota bacterium]